MDLAVKTVASTAEIWVMVILLSILTGILVSAATMADAWQVRANRRARRLAALGFREIGGADPDAGPVTAVVAGDMTSADAAGGGRDMVPAPRPGAAAADAPTRPDLPAVPGGPALPGQRGGESDRAERAGADQAADQRPDQGAGGGLPPDDDPGQRQP